MAERTTESDVAAIRGELGRSGVSATTMNFIVWIDDVGHRDWVLERTRKLGEKHPSRTIVLDASVAGGVSLVRSNRDTVDHDTVQGDVVEIGCKDMPAAATREAVQSLAIGEVPTVLWWTSETIGGSPASNELLDIADALVVDSSGSTTGVQTIRDLAGFLANRPKIGLRDLAWMRLRPWQDMIAQFFDDPRLREELFTIESLKIVSGSEAEALYLAGWLGSRLGWSACGHREFCDRSGASIPFEYVREGGIRRVKSINVTTRASAYTASVSYSDENVVSVRAAGDAAQAGRFVPLQAIDNASLLERAILEPPTDEVFETALRMVGMLLA